MGTRTPTYYTGTITGQAGSLITVLDAILVTGEGWTKTYSGTNKAVYTQASHNGFCIRVLDDGSVTGGAKEAVVRGAESATDVDTLVDPFPTVAQLANNGCVWRKSETADSTTRTYHAFADGGIIHLYIETNTYNYDLYTFGSPEEVYSGDGYCCYITVRFTANSSTNAMALAGHVIAPGGDASQTNGAMYFARSADGSVKSDFAGILKKCSSRLGNHGQGRGGYPNTSTGKLGLSFVEVLSQRNNSSGTASDGTTIRGVVPFMFEPMIGSPITSLDPYDTFEGSDYDATANSLMMFRFTNSWTDGGEPRIVMQKAGTWDPGF